jgi:hypothetical protein
MITFIHGPYETFVNGPGEVLRVWIDGRLVYQKPTIDNLPYRSLELIRRWHREKGQPLAVRTMCQMVIVKRK